MSSAEKKALKAPFPKTGPSIFIIGAGIGGISLGIELDSRGLTNWQIYERDDGVGGTWWANRYPGCRCDVPAIVYSHSKFPNPNWKETHPPREDIQKYWEDIARSQNQMDRIHLQRNVGKAIWDAERGVYTITVTNTVTGEESTVEANIIISAFGLLSNAKHIELPGQEDFQGRVIHAAEWPRDLNNEEFRGKTVVVVGNGCSGVQIVSTLGQDPEINLVSLSRAKQWFVPNPPGSDQSSVPYTKSKNELWARFPIVQYLTRMLYITVMDSHWYWFLTRDGAKFRNKTEKQLATWMKSAAPEYLRDEIVPDFSFGAKRLIRVDGYFDALNQPNVKAVRGRIKSFRSNAIVLDDGQEMSADYVILATGYDAESVDVDVAGTEDRTKNYKSKADWAQYHGIALAGIPNYFTILGNNMGLNHMSIIAVEEINASYIGQLIQAMRDYSIPALDVKLEAAKAYTDRIQHDLTKTTWHQVSNYWRANNGKGRIFTHYPGSVRKLWWDNRSPVWSDYRGAETIVRRQRVRRILLSVLLLVLAGWGARRHGHSPKSIVQQLATSAVGLVHSAEGVASMTLNRIKSIAGM